MHRVTLTLAAVVPDVQTHSSPLRRDVVGPSEVVVHTEDPKDPILERRQLHSLPVFQLHREIRKRPAIRRGFRPLGAGDEAGAERKCREENERATEHDLLHVATAGSGAAGGGTSLARAHGEQSIMRNATAKRTKPENS